ncbi:MAG: hypothetical protein PHE33_12725 [Bacteroidales bacterium]|nr:hypothetical protein [Bacteroidales bacterium]
MEKKIDLVKIKEHFPFNYYNIVLKRHKKAMVIDMKDALSVSVPCVQNERAFYRSFYKPLTRFI